MDNIPLVIANWLCMKYISCKLHFTLTSHIYVIVRHILYTVSQNRTLFGLL